jgi:UDP-glucose 4-epimerase
MKHKRNKVKKPSALVLGSEGLIGSHLVQELGLKGFNVHEFDIRNNKTRQDLSKESSKKLLRSLMKKSDVVYFLAFDVGGANYLEKHEHEYAFIENNISIMKNVFAEIKKQNKLVIFTSTMMTKIPKSTYGLLKLLGERYVGSVDGISVQFWNIYGINYKHPDEKEKNHVMNDFAISALKNGKIETRTDGEESRQFLHVKDACSALIRLANKQRHVKTWLKTNNLSAFEISSGEWVKIKDLAKMFEKATKCKLIFAQKKDRVQKDAKIEPGFALKAFTDWKPTISLDVGVKEALSYYDTSFNR